ncbi:MAG: hypothetical protein HKN16_05225 [Saprospiraceae bacterium]|nr:hypothetical protein [Saprospiraceae bacterium]
MEKLLLYALFFLASCSGPKPEVAKEQPIYISLFGKQYFQQEASEVSLGNLEKARLDFEKDPNDLDNIIWYGRRTAYLGNYQDAIDIYSKGLTLFPNESRLYRHRGHRYISNRQFEKAISDLERASKLIEGTENSIEEDGLPNARNIPVSTKHGNIWYHLGLAYYLVHNYESSYQAYLNCRESGSMDDNIVSSTHWLYMIQRRMSDPDKAKTELDLIQKEMDIIENASYYELCLLYKGLASIDSFSVEGEDPSSDALRYGLANYQLYNGDTLKAKRSMTSILEGDTWNSFGYIAAESDFKKYFSN